MRYRSLVLLAAVACGGSTPPPASASAQPYGGAAPKHETAAYVVELKAPQGCVVGEACRPEIALATKGVFHINEKYPLKFSAASSGNVRFTHATWRRTDGTFEETKGVLPLELTATSAGRYPIGGILFFSVCTAETCLTEKAELEVNVDVK